MTTAVISNVVRDLIYPFSFIPYLTRALFFVAFYFYLIYPLSLFKPFERYKLYELLTKQRLIQNFKINTFIRINIVA